MPINIPEQQFEPAKNLIQRQADDFFEEHVGYNWNSDHRKFLSEVRSNLVDYNKTSHQIEFLERLIYRIKIAFDAHYIVCGARETGERCSENEFYENALFFLQNELEDRQSELDGGEITTGQKLILNDTLESIIRHLNDIKLGQQLTYDDFVKEFEELKSFYFLNKRSWSQLALGKMTEMVAGGVVSETLSKEIVELLKKNM